jgi:hypothetical protein
VRPRLAGLALLAAVGAAALAPATPRAAATATDTRRFAPPKVIDTNPAHSSGEPSIRVSGDGTIYIAGPTGLGGVRAPITLPVEAGSGGDLLWKSTDGGVTWTYLGSYDGSIGGGDADITTSADGVVFASGLYLACISVARSADDGATFVPSPTGGCSYTVVDDRQWNDVDTDGTVYTAFGNTGGAAAGQIFVVPSLVSAPVVVPGPAIQVSVDPNYQWPGVLDIDQRDGTVYVAWNTSGAPNDCDDPDNPCDGPAGSVTPDEIRLGVLKKGASAAEAPKLVATRTFDTFDAFVGVDVGADGRIYVVWNERHPTVGETWTMLSSSANGGDTWTAPVRVGSAAHTTVFPWVSVGDAGRVAVSYYGTTAKGRSPETVSGDWYVWSSFSTDGGATFQEYKTTPHYIHQGAVCTSGTGCASGARDLLDFFETDTDANGCLVTTYTDNSRDVVDADGTRSENNVELLGFVRQSAGPGLRAGKDCSGPGLTTGSGGTGGTGGGGTGGTGGGPATGGTGSGPTTPATGLDAAFALAAAGIAAVAAMTRRALRR